MDLGTAVRLRTARPITNSNKTLNMNTPRIDYDTSNYTEVDEDRGRRKRGERNGRRGLDRELPDQTDDDELPHLGAAPQPSNGRRKIKPLEGEDE